jgi:hypothetical protein
MYKPYKIKKLIEGYKPGYDHKEKMFICIPEKRLIRTTEVVFENQSMNISGEPIYKKTFTDKFNSNRMYTLFYYEWRPAIFQSLF